MTTYAGRWAVTGIAAAILGATALSGSAFAQVSADTRFGGGVTDPGVRGGAPGAGGPVAGLTAAQLGFFNAAKVRFGVVETGMVGLGPGFNELSCQNCHISPAIGGSSPAVNPQVTDGVAMGAKNSIPPFITANGPIRETRFVSNPDGTPDGNVHAIFSIQGRTDAPGCTFPQPDYAAQLAKNNVVFRIPTPTYGGGLVEALSDATLMSSFAAQAGKNASLGISGTFNHAGNTGNIARFGWKAQNASLLLFAGEAYNVEEGITNDLFPNERNAINAPGVTVPAACSPAPLPEDTVPSTDGGNSTSAVSDLNSDIENFSMFMRLLAAPTPAVPFTGSTTAGSPPPAAPVQVASAATTSVLGAAAGTTSTTSTSSATPSAASIQAGFQAFTNIGCSGCHTVSLTTGKASPVDTAVIASMSNITINTFSDWAIHNMGTGLADGVSQGNANGNQFRTAPLWGLGQRTFFLHDGRTNNLVTAIAQHASSGSEANQVIQNFNMLPPYQKQNIINFLRDL